MMARAWVAVLLAALLLPPAAAAQDGPPASAPPPTSRVGQADHFGGRRPPPLLRERERRAIYLLAKQGGEIEEGTTASVMVRVAPAVGRVGTVGFLDASVGERAHYYGRATGWMAVTLACFLTGQPFDRWDAIFHGLLAKTRGDGPSHGAFLTIVVMAALLDDDLLPDVSMTGGINPDGSIGPVGGIGQKLYGAKKAGITKVLFPSGQRVQKTGSAGQPQDLVALGKSLGVEAVEVADIFEAYPHFTGRQLPRPPREGQALRVETAIAQAAVHNSNRWESIFQDRVALLNRLAPSLPQTEREDVSRLWRQAHAARNDSRQRLGAGDPLAAWALSFHAAQTAEMAALMTQVILSTYAGGLEAAKKTLQGYIMTPEEMDRVTTGLNLPDAANLNDYLTLAGVFGFSTFARGANARASWVLTRMDDFPDSDKALKVARLSASLAVTARGYHNLLPDLLRLGLGHPGPPTPSLRRAAPWVLTLSRALDSNLAMVEARLLDIKHEETHVPVEMSKERLLWTDLQYLMVEGCRPFVGEYIKAFDVELFLASAGKKDREPDRHGVAPLGAAGVNWVMSALVWAKQYTLPATEEPAFGLVAPQLDQERLQRMLALADEQLSGAIAQAQARGWTPVLPLLHLVAARTLAGPGFQQSQQAASLTDYWMGAMLTRLGLVLAEGDR